MLIGQEYDIDGKKYLVLGFYELNDSKYVLLSMGEELSDTDYKFYKMKELTSGDVDLLLVDNPLVEAQLFDLVKNEEEK